MKIIKAFDFFAFVAVTAIIVGVILATADAKFSSDPYYTWTAYWQDGDGWHRMSTNERPIDMYLPEMNGYMLIDDSTGESYLVCCPVWKYND